MNADDLTHREKAVLSGFAGALGAIVSNPFEVIMVRQVSDLGKQKEFVHGHSNSISKAVNEVGAQKRGYFRGLTPNLLKAVLLNAFLTGPYDYLKERMWITFGDVWPNTLVALIGASVVGTLVTLPVDNLKTRIQNQHSNPSLNRLNYSGTMSALTKSLEYEGFNGLFVGLFPYYIKILAYSAVVN